MSELIDRIREQTEHAHDAAEGYFTPAEIRELLAEIDRAHERETKLLAKIPEAWAEGAEDEARERDGDEFAITMTCSLSNPYLDWSEPDEEGFMHSSPTQDPFKAARD